MKPSVVYTETVYPPAVGESAIVLGIAGHTHGLIDDVADAAITSEVVRVGEDGEFETLNTIYRRKA
jgi:hypothetical protein